MNNVVISYGRSDIEFVQALAAALSKSLTVWYDANLSIGDGFSEEIPFRILSSTCVISVWSGKSLRSSWVRSEANQALALGKLLSISIDGTLPPAPLDTLHTEVFKDNLDSIVRNINVRISKMSKSTVDFSESFQQYKCKINTKLRSIVGKSHSSRLQALRVEREGYDIYEKADAAFHAAVARRPGHGTIEKGDVVYIGETETPLISLHERAHGYGVIKDTWGTTYSRFSSGTQVGTRVIKLRDEIKIFDAITVGADSSNSGFVGVVEKYPGFRFEGELSQPHVFVPDGFGVAWGEGEFLSGRMKTSENPFSTHPAGICILVSSSGESEIIDFDQ